MLICSITLGHLFTTFKHAFQGPVMLIHSLPMNSTHISATHTCLMTSDLAKWQHFWPRHRLLATTFTCWFLTRPYISTENCCECIVYSILVDRACYATSPGGSLKNWMFTSVKTNPTIYPTNKHAQCTKLIEITINPGNKSPKINSVIIKT